MEKKIKPKKHASDWYNGFTLLYTATFLGGFLLLLVSFLLLIFIPYMLNVAELPNWTFFLVQIVFVPTCLYIGLTYATGFMMKTYAIEKYSKIINYATAYFFIMQIIFVNAQIRAELNFTLLDFIIWIVETIVVTGLFYYIAHYAHKSYLEKNPESALAEKQV